MRVFKLAGLALIVVALVSMWQRREWVTSAYLDDPEPIGFVAGGVDLSFEPVALGSSPFVIAAAPRTSGVVLPRLANLSIDTSVAIDGGDAILTGLVHGPEGPVAGATIVLERFVGTNRGETRVYSDETGAWSASGIHGGAYRIRVFLASTYVSPAAELMFVEAGSATNLSTVLGLFQPSMSLALHGGQEIYPGQEQTVAFVATTTIVDEEGRLLVVPVAGTPVTISVSGSATLLSSNVVLTDAGGAARFRLRCDRVGGISYRAEAELIPLSGSLPSCIAEPPPEPVVEAPVEGETPVEGEAP